MSLASQIAGIRIRIPENKNQLDGLIPSDMGRREQWAFYDSGTLIYSALL